MEDIATKDETKKTNGESFFMTSGRSSSVENGQRSGNGHVTPEELQQKLQEFKHHLDIVKSLYNNSSNHSNINNNNFLDDSSPQANKTNTHHGIDKWREEIDKSQIFIEIAKPAIEGDNAAISCSKDAKETHENTMSLSPRTDSNINENKKGKIPKNKTTFINSNEKVDTIISEIFRETKTHLPKGRPTTIGKRQSHENDKIQQKNAKYPSSEVKNTVRKKQPVITPPYKNGSREFNGNVNGCGSDFSASADSPQNTAIKIPYDSDTSKRIAGKRKPSTAKRTTKNSAENNKNANLQSIYDQKVKELKDETTLQELSYNLKEKHFEIVRGELQARCGQYEMRIYELEQKSRDHNTRNGELEINYHKLNWKHKKLSEEYHRLERMKVSIEKELHNYQKMLNESCCTHKEVEKCLQVSQESESSLKSKLVKVEAENNILKEDLIEIKGLCMESDKQLDYYQHMETDLQQCMNKAILQITQLEQQTVEKSIEHRMVYEKLTSEHENLRREHEAAKMLYSEALRKVDDSVKINDELKRSLQMRSLTSSIEMLNIASCDEMYNPSISSRNQSPFLTLNHSPHIHRKQPLRRTWFSQDIPLMQFQPADDTASEGGYFNKPNISNHKANSLRGNERRSYYSDHLHQRAFRDYNTAESDTDSTISCRSAASVKSCTIEIERELSKRLRVNHHLYPQYSTSDEKEVQSVQTKSHESHVHTFNTKQRPQSWYVPFSTFNMNGQDGNRYKQKQPKNSVSVSQRNLSSNSDVKLKSRIPLQRKSEVGTTTLGNSKAPAQCIDKSMKSTSPVTPTNQQTAKIPSKTKTNSMTSSSVHTPCNVSRTYLTTEEVLAAVQETNSIDKSTKQSNRKVRSTSKPPSRLEQLAITRGMEEAKEIITLEDQLKQLTEEKEKLNSRLGRIPTRSSSRSNHTSIAEECEIEKRYEEVMKNIAAVRTALKKRKVL